VLPGYPFPNILIATLVDIRVICKVPGIGGEKCQFRHIRPSNMYLRIKILSNKITGTQTSFSSNFDGKLSFILSFLRPEPLHWCYIYFHCSYLYNYYNYSRTFCIKCEFQYFILRFNKISLLFRYHRKRG